jgi:hypothetical protein
MSIGAVLSILIIALAHVAEVVAASPDRAPVDYYSFHNQLHTFKAHPKITKHAKQMGYAYTSQPDSRTEGLKYMYTGLDANYVWIVHRDGWYWSDDGLIPAKQEEYDRYACIRNPQATDPLDRYYIAWGLITMWSGRHVFMGGFFIDYQNEEALTSALAYYQNAISWEQLDAIFVDQVDRELLFWLVSPNKTDITSSGAAVTECLNASPRNYSVQDGFLRYRAALISLFRSHGLLISANVWKIGAHGEELHSTSPVDHYYNEHGGPDTNDAQTFGSVPPGTVTVEIPYPQSQIVSNFDVTLRTAGIAGRQSSWFGSYGEAWEWILSAGMNAIQLLRAIPNWDNLVDASGRSWDGAVYRSSQSYADQTIVYSHHPTTGKLFVVFRSETAVLPLRDSEAIVSVQCVDDIFVEREDCAGHLAVKGNEVRLTEASLLNKGYILEVR